MERPGAAPFAAGSLRRLDLVLLAAGIGLLVYLVVRLGAADIGGHLRLVGAGILLVVAQEILAIMANTWGWYAAFRAPRPRIPLSRLLSARIAGDAINYLTPTAGLGGEFVRARYLRDDVPETALAASVVVAKLSQFAAQLIFVLAGLAIILPQTSLPPALRYGLAAGLALFVVLVVALIVVQRRGMFTPLLRFVRRLGIVRIHPALGERLALLDAEISRYHLDGHRAFATSVAAFLVGWALGMLEVAIMLWLLDIPVSFHLVLAIEVLSIVIDALLFFVPAKAGTQEAGKVLIFSSLGLDPAKGLTLGILRRVRELAWAGVGVLLLWRARAG